MAAPARTRKVPVCLGPFILRTQRFSSRGSAVAPKRGREVAPAAQSVWHTSFPLEARCCRWGARAVSGAHSVLFTRFGDPSCGNVECAPLTLTHPSAQWAPVLGLTPPLTASVVEQV